jgi:hypothetical protein
VNDDAFQEVNKSLREEQLAKAWKRWSIFVYLGVGAIVVGVGVMEFMRYQRNEAIAQASRTYDAGFAALEASDLATARARFSELTTNDTGFAVLAGHMLAGIERDLTNDNAAIEAHLKNAAASDDGVMGDLALLKLGYLQADTVTRAQLEATMKPLLDRPGQAALLARELIAAKALAEGDVEFARDTFEVLDVDINAPGAMRERVSRALATLPARAVNLDAPAATPAVTTETPAKPAPAAGAPAQDATPAAPTGQPQQ